MPGGDPDHPSRRRRAVRRALTAVVLVLALVSGGFAAYRYGPLDDWIDDLTTEDGSPTPPAGPAAVPPPAGLVLPALTTPPPVAVAATPGPLDSGKVRRALRPYLDDPVLGRHVIAAVVGLDGTPVYHRGEGAATPASTTKLLTTVAALATLGPEHRFATRVVAAGRGRIVLVGGGDPFLEPAPDPGSVAEVTTDRGDLTTLARLTAARLIKQGRPQVRVGYDDTLFSGPVASPTWEPDYLPDDVVSPITALWVDEARDPTGYGYAADPSGVAAQVFARALAAAGVRVLGEPERGQASGGRELARVESPPLRQIAERILLVSDNQAAEVLGHQVGLAVEGVGSFDAGARSVRAALADLGVDPGALAGTRLYDGSGLSRRNRISPQLLVGVLEAVVDPGRPELRTVLTSLPVAAFTGSLATRFYDADPAGRGRVRAKTGTLKNVFSLAGIATGPDGRPMLFALMADRIAKDDTDRAQEVLDDAAGALGACRCGRS